MEIAACQCLISEALVKPLVVVEAEVSVQASPEFVSRFARVQVQNLYKEAQMNLGAKEILQSQMS